MSTPSRVVLVPSLAAISLVMVASTTVAGQTMSGRPASVSLTVVVPPRPEGHLTTAERTTVVRQTASALDFQAMVGVADHLASRIEVRLGSGWTADSARVLVQNQHGVFEPLAVDAAIVAASAPASMADARSLLRFRLESNRPMATAAVAIPVEYRITVGHSDQIAVWSFPTLIQLRGTR
jgi:hypothetical protein